MGEADLALGQTDEKPPDTGLIPGDDSVVWSHEVEVCLFHAMLGHKPVGVNRHFHMICIRDKFSQNIGRQVSSSVIWDHLGTMYDMQALHESEILPFPNSEKSFSLPDDIIQDVKEGKGGGEEEQKEFKMEREPPATHEEGSNSSVKLVERGSSRDKERDKEREKEREKGPSEGGGGGGVKEAEKRKRSRGQTEKLISSSTSSSHPASPGGTKRRRT
ncbi:unnamed protein product [Lota lota]